jgi:hypothetical protein
MLLDSCTFPVHLSRCLWPLVVGQWRAMHPHIVGMLAGIYTTMPTFTDPYMQ